MQTKIKNILTDLERVRENLLSLSDDIWLSIDHNDSRALKEGVDFKLEYNEKMGAFDRLATGISDLIQAFTKVRIDGTTTSEETNKDAGTNERIIMELDKETPHSLSEDFRYKRPYGFVLDGRAFKDIVTWKRVYELVCHVLSKRDPARFSCLPQNPNFTSSRGNPYFSGDPEKLRSAMLVDNEIYAEINLSANGIRDSIRNLLDAFEISLDDMKVYLREDRDANPE